MTQPPCPHCPDGHTPPDGGSQRWAAWVGPERDGDGQPTTIHVARTGGAHVAEPDAEWIRRRLNPAAEGFAVARPQQQARPDTAAHALDGSGEPAELRSLPHEVRRLVHAVDRMRAAWAEARPDSPERRELWTAVHTACDAVWDRAAARPDNTRGA